jgi:hypothetical protein
MDCDSVPNMCHALGLATQHPSFEDSPAVGRVTISCPGILRSLADFNAGKKYCSHACTPFRACVAGTYTVRPSFGNVQRGASVFLIWMGCLVIPVVGLIETAGGREWCIASRRIFQARISFTCGTRPDHLPAIRWECTRPGAYLLALAISFGYWTTGLLVVQRLMVAKDLRGAGGQRPRPHDLRNGGGKCKQRVHSPRS